MTIHEAMKVLSDVHQGQLVAPEQLQDAIPIVLRYVAQYTPYR